MTKSKTNKFKQVNNWTILNPGYSMKILIHCYIINASIKLIDLFHKQGEGVFAQFMRDF